MITIEPTEDDAALAAFYHEHWLEMGVAKVDVRGDWREAALAFMREARGRRAFAGFLALDGATAVGGACCQLIDRVYPPFAREDVLVSGYLWGVYVRPDHRRRGIATVLVRACGAHLRAAGARRILLHAGAASRSLYARLGFSPTEEMAHLL